MEKVIILGAGLSGLAAAHCLRSKYDVTILEKSGEKGGLCQSFHMEGFWFDYGAHAAFTKSEKVSSMLEKGVKSENSLSEAMNYKKGKWIRQPVQNNLYVLDIDEKINIIKGFIERQDDNQYRDYGDCLKKKYGVYFAENYPYLYTEKYWTVKPHQMETKWIGPRMYTPSIEEILYGSYTEKTPNIHYAGTIRYPERGGFARYLDRISDGLLITYNADITKINTEEKYVEFNGERIDYNHIISTIPLREVVKVMPDVPCEVSIAANKLDYTSLVIVSVGVNKTHVMPEDAKCFYIYDREMIASRVYSTSEYGSKNAPEGCQSVQAEVYFSKHKPMNMTLDEIKNKVISELISLDMFEKSDIIVSDVRMKEYANIIFTHDIYDNRDIVHKYLDSQNVIYAGRFGEWGYLWSDQSVLSGINASEKVLQHS